MAKTLDPVENQLAWLENSVAPASRNAWRAWLVEHHERDEGTWVVQYKKATKMPTVTNDELVSEAIAFGWIDSTPRKIDAERFAVWVSPRRAGSNWSQLSRDRAAAVTASGRMTPAGQAAVDRAKADGTWTNLEPVEALEIPDDLAEALAARPPAAEEFEKFPPSVKRGILEWVTGAKTDKTRSKRVHETAFLAEVGKRANQWPRQVRLGK